VYQWMKQHELTGMSRLRYVTCYWKYYYSDSRPNAPAPVAGEGAAAVPEARQQHPAAHDPNQPIALGAGLQQSVTALLDAMRDLLSNANANNPPNQADGEDSATEDED